MLAVPPSAVALSSIFLYNCTNAMFAYLTNIVQMSMLQLITIQAVSHIMIYPSHMKADHSDTEPYRLLHIHCSLQDTGWNSRSTWNSSCIMDDGYICKSGDITSAFQPQSAHAFGTCFCKLSTAVRDCPRVMVMAR